MTTVTEFTPQTRGQWIAHLELHGWRAVRDSPRDARRFDGIYNESIQLGFAWFRGLAGGRVIRLDPTMFPGTEGPHVVEWDEIDTWVLGKIDERLREV